MDPPTREQVAKLQNCYWDVLEENAELKTSVLEKDELIARLRRQLNTANHKVRVEAIDNNVAKIYTTNENGNPLPMPVNVSLRTGEDVNVPVYNNEFLIVWIESYVLAVGGVDILWLHNQKQQAFSASNGITAFSLDMNMEPPLLQNQLPFYVTQEQFVACELRIMQRMQQHLNDINDARTELITSNMHMQQQINHVRDAVRALEHSFVVLLNLLDRIVLPVLVEEFMLLKAGTAEHPPPLVQIVMMYDTGSSLTYLTKEVLETLGYEPSYDILKRDEMFDVKINGWAMQVELCPKERCEHWEDKVLVLSDGQREVSCPALDWDAVASEVRGALVPGKAVSCIAFIGAGSAENEVALLHAMGNVGGCSCTDGVRRQQVAFLDTCFTTRSLQNVKCYADGLSDQQPRPALLFSFKDLTTFLQRQHALRPAEQFIVLGINAGMTMNSAEELYECHRFLCQCAEWAAGGAMHQQYMNFMGDANHWRVPGRSVHLGTRLWCYQSPWWELAKDLMTDTSAELLLLGRLTA
eukprot:gene24912-biopygen19336